MSDSKKWIVTLSGDRPLKEVKKDLTKAGFKIDQTLDEIGSIIGSGGATVIKRVRSVPGVADVSQDEAIDIGPPDSPETW